MQLLKPWLAMIRSGHNTKASSRYMASVAHYKAHSAESGGIPENISVEEVRNFLHLESPLAPLPPVDYKKTSEQSEGGGVANREDVAQNRKTRRRMSTVALLHPDREVVMPKWPVLPMLSLDSGGPSFLRSVQAAIAAHWVDKAEKEAALYGRRSSTTTRRESTVDRGSKNQSDNMPSMLDRGEKQTGKPLRLSKRVTRRSKHAKRKKSSKTVRIAGEGPNTGAKIGAVSSAAPSSEKAESVAAAAANQLVQAMDPSARDAGDKRNKKRNPAARTLKRNEASKDPPVLESGASRTGLHTSTSRRKSFSKAGQEHVDVTAAAMNAAREVAGTLNSISE